MIGYQFTIYILCTDATSVVI